IDYAIDGNGWTARRGDTFFEYDVYGRVQRAYRAGVVDIAYGYDDQSRLIWRRVGEEYFFRFFYAFPDRPYLLTHYARAGESLSTILYDEADAPFAVYSDGKYYALFLDGDGSVRFIFAPDGNTVKEIIHSPLGATITNRTDTFYFPLGYRQQFEDSVIGIVIMGPEARPYDTYAGRFMSVPITFATSRLDVFAPEFEADPFRAKPTQANTLRNFPLDLDRWMEMSGFTLSQVLPVMQKPNRNPNIHRLLNVPAELCAVSWNHVLCSAFCSVFQKTTHFRQLLTATSPLLLPASSSTPPFFHAPYYKASYSSSDSVGFRGMILSRHSPHKFEVVGHSTADDVKLDAFNALLKHSSLLNIAVNLSTLPTQIHFVTNATYDSLAVSKLEALFNVSSLDYLLLLQAGNTQLLFHLNDNPEIVKQAIIREQSNRIVSLIWEDETGRARSGALTRHSWTEAELSQLRKTGRVNGYEIQFRPGKTMSLLTNTHLWSFQRTAS
ncbi:unnamed protein product, partial [Gongylonema pulchrum]|uniref:Tox-GHH domain-containing protein n=1 Tax=Gongylonema pulchrum TaxID=637853 RepID=A0A183CZA4_9BILA